MRTAKDGAPLEPESETSPVRIKKAGIPIDPADFLGKAGTGKTVINLKERETVFSRGDLADAVFYIRKGQVNLTSVSQNGKEATIAQLDAGDFIGEECITPDHPIRTATATALTECKLLKVDRKEILRVLHEEPAFSGLFVSYLLARSTQLEADLVE